MHKTILAAAIIACAASTPLVMAQEAAVPAGPNMRDAGGSQGRPGMMPMAQGRPQAYAGTPGGVRDQRDPRTAAT
ncbi:MAG: hypothetical protein WBM81_20710, partial [Sedimenticolaceae bacterium]